MGSRVNGKWQLTGLATPSGMTTPSIHSRGNFVYKHVDIYFLDGWQARAVE